MKPKLEIKNLVVKRDGKQIISDLNLTINGGEVHAIMGPNGTGKSTLLNTIMGHPAYEVVQGSIVYNGKNLLEMSVDERAREGIFLAMQNPLEVPGVTNSDFIKTAMSKRNGKNISFMKFFTQYEKAIDDLKMRSDLPHRYLNEGFSGGEKKKNEIVQMKVLKPNIALLDEIDSGLDVDALRIVGENIERMKSDELAILLVTHYQRILDYIKPNIVHVMVMGKIVKTGGTELIEKIDRDGYEWVKEELGIEIDDDISKRSVLGSCASKEIINNK